MFNRSAPIIKLKEGATEEEHLALLAYLNSSTVGFILRQECQEKQMMGGDGIRHSDKTTVTYEFGAAGVGRIFLVRASLFLVRAIPFPIDRPPSLPACARTHSTRGRGHSSTPSNTQSP